jgi:hypothetical protein
MVVQAETGRLGVQGQSRLHRDTLSQKPKQTSKNKKNQNACPKYKMRAQK